MILKVVLTSQRHASKLSPPAYDSQNEQEPPSEPAIVCGRSNGREYKGHDLLCEDTQGKRGSIGRSMG